MPRIDIYVNSLKQAIEYSIRFGNAKNVIDMAKWINANTRIICSAVAVELEIRNNINEWEYSDALLKLKESSNV